MSCFKGNSQEPKENSCLIMLPLCHIPSRKKLEDMKRNNRADGVINCGVTNSLGNHSDYM